MPLPALAGLIRTVGTASGVVGGLAGKLKKAHGSFDKLKKGAFETGDALDAVSTGLGFVSSGLGVVGSAIDAVTAQIKKSVDAFADYDDRLRGIQAVSGLSRKELDALGDAAREAASAAGFDVSQAFVSLQKLADSGMNAAQQLGSLTPALDLARTSGLEVGKATDVLVRTLLTFRKGAQDSSAVADTLAAAIGSTASSGPQLADGLDKAGASAASFGQSFESTVAALGLLSSSTASGAAAGTALQGVLSALAEKGGELGVAVADSSGRMLPLVEILENLEAQGVTSQEVIAQLGDKAGPALAELLAHGSKALSELESGLESQGQAAAAAGERADTLGGDVGKLGAATTGIFQAIGAVFEPATRAVVQFFTQIAEKMRELIENNSATITLISDVIAGLIDLVAQAVGWVAGLIGKAIELGRGFLAVLGPVGALIEGFLAAEEGSARLAQSWDFLRSLAFSVFASIVSGITTLVDKSLGAIQALFDFVAKAKDIPVLSGLAKKAEEVSTQIGGLRAKIRGFGGDLAAGLDTKADEAMDRYAEATSTAAATASRFGAANQDVVKLLKTQGDAAEEAAEKVDRLRQAQEAIDRALDAVAGPLADVSSALSDLETSSILDASEKMEAFEGSVDVASAAVTEQKAKLEELAASLEALGEGNEDAEEAAKLLREALGDLGGSLDDAKGAAEDFWGQFGEEALEARKALAALETAQGEEGIRKAEEFKTAMERLRDAIREARGELQNLAPGADFDQRRQDAEGMEQQFEQLKNRGEEVGVTLAESVAEGGKEGAEEANEHYQKLVDGITKELNSAFSDLFKGSTEGFEDLFDNIADLFADLLADMVTQWLKSELFSETAGGGGEGGGLGGLFKSFRSTIDQFNQPEGGFDAGSLLGAAGYGYSVGSLFGSAFGKDDNYAKEASEILGTVGAIVGSFIPVIGTALGGLIGSALGSLIGSFIKRGLPRASATLALRDGEAAVERFVTANKGSLEQITKLATTAVDGINELVDLTGGTLLSLPEIEIKTHKNKFFSVVDGSGFEKKFGEDYEAAVEYAILQALKGAELGDISDEVRAVLENTQATTPDELAADIQFAREIETVDLHSVAKSLRDVIEKFNEMRERASDLGISLDKVDNAFNKAIGDLRESLESDLQAFEEMGLTDVEREARRITEAFAEMRENARQFNAELMREKEARNGEIEALQGQLAEQERLQEQYDQLAGIDFPELPEIDDEFGFGTGRIRPDFERLAREAGEEIARLMEEIARLVGLNAEQQLIDLQRIEEAERQARAALRERVRDQLDSFRISNLTSVQQQLRQLDKTFEKLRRDARAAGVPMGEVASALAAAREAIRNQVEQRLQPFEDVAQGLTPLQVELRNLEQTFEELRTDAGEVGIELERVDAAFEAAVENLRDQLRDELRTLADAGANPVVVQIRDLTEQFLELRQSAEALGVSVAEVDAAYQAALAAQADQLRDGVQAFLDYGAGLTELEVRYRDLGRFFEEQIEAARALDEAQGFAGPGAGPNEQLVLDAETAAFQQLVDEFNASLRDLRDAGLSPVALALRDVRERFSELRENAELLGLSVDELSRLEQEAVDRLRGELQSSLDQYLLSDSEREDRALEDEFFGFLRDALDLFGFDSGLAAGSEPAEEELFPGARELEERFRSVIDATGVLEAAFLNVAGVLDLETAMMRDRMADELTLTSAGLPFPFPEPIPLPLPRHEPPPELPAPSAGETVLQAIDRLEEILGGAGLEDLGPQASDEITTAAADLDVLLEQLRLGLTDDVPAVQAALADFAGLLAGSGLELGDSLTRLIDTLSSGDVGSFLEELGEQAAFTGEGFGALLEALLSGDLSLPDLMRDLANGTFDAIAALLGLEEIPEDLAAMLEDIGLAFREAERQQGERRNAGRNRDASQAAEQAERDREALIQQLEGFEDSELTQTERNLKALDRQFDEMRESAQRLGIPLERVEAAYQIAFEQERKAVEERLKPFEELGLTPVERELRRIEEQFEELARSADAVGIPAERVEEARQAALEQQRQVVEDQLRPFEEIGLTPVERELRNLDEQFEEIRASAEAVGIPMERVEAAYEAALEQQRDAVREQLRPFQEIGLTPIERELRRLDEQFEDIRASASALGIPLEEVDAAYQAALEQQRDALRDQLRPFNELELTPVERELLRLEEQFDDIRASASALGIPLEEVDAAYQAAIEQQREALRDQLKPFNELGLTSVERELLRLDEQFEELRTNAIALGIPLEEVDAAYQAAIQQQRDALADQLRPFEELGLSGPERELLRLNEQFEEIRTNAEALGFDVERVDAAYQAAIEDFWDRVLDPIRDFRDSLLLSDFSPLTPEERLDETRARFDELAALALEGDFDAIQALPGAAQELLGEAQGFFASGQGFQDVFELVQSVLDQVLTDTPTSPELPGETEESPTDLVAATEGSLSQLSTVIDRDLVKVSDSFESLVATTGQGLFAISDAIDRKVLEMVDRSGGSFLPSFLPYLDVDEADFVSRPRPGTIFKPPVIRPADDVEPRERPRPKGEAEDSAVVDELRMGRRLGHADSLALQQKLDDQAVEIRELRTLMRRMTSRVEVGGRG